MLRESALFTLLALFGFAANSLFCRAALRSQEIDPASFTSIRIVSGAITLAVIARFLGSPSSPPSPPSPARSWSRVISGFALFAYAIGFSLAYVRLDAGTGALLLFGSVQTTMVGWAIARGGERPGVREWVGLLAALGGLVLLVLPSMTSSSSSRTTHGSGLPDAEASSLLATFSMIAAGVAWGVYSLRGRGTTNPIRATATNFAVAVPFAIAVSLALLRSTHISTLGALYAIGSGAVASGLGYSLWYAALPSLTATRAGIVQLAVPIVAAFGGVLLFGEHLTSRLGIATCAILGGIAFATMRPKKA